jgi:hypothetical protein
VQGAAHLAAVDVEGRDDLDVPREIPAHVEVHEPPGLLGLVRQLSVVLDAL